MDKLKQLLGALGGSKQLTDAICEELANYTSRIKAKYDEEYNTKVKRAKQICLEEIAKEKAALARKVAVFLESKVNVIQQASTRQRAIEESEAKSLLKRAKSLLEGIEVSDDGVVRDLSAAQKKSERLERALATLKEERDQAVKRANKANEIATKALKHCNALESKLKTTAPVTEAAVTPKPKIVEDKSKAAPRRLDESRIVPASARSTRPTPVTQVSAKPANGTSPSADDQISQIASAIDENV